MCSHGAGPDCDLCATWTCPGRKLRRLNDHTAVDDAGHTFWTIPDSTGNIRVLSQDYARLPAKAERVKGTCYVNDAGRLVSWNGSMLQNACEHTDCSRQPTFNVEGAARGRYCADHKQPGMLDVKNKRCEHTGCTSITPAFNVEGSTRGRFCSTHKQQGMVNVRSKRCEHPGCTSITPVFNVEGAARGRFCGRHKQQGMVDVKDKRCEHTGCTAQPVFNVEGSTRGRFCTKHKLSGMVDVKHNRCALCSTRAQYGYPGFGASRCAQHKLDGMKTKPNRRCTVCREFAVYGIREAEHCETHQWPGDLNLLERTCVQCGLLGLLDPSGFCEYCVPGVAKTMRLAKQREVEQYITVNMPDHPPDSVDRIPQDLKDCNRRERPDILWDLGDRVIIVEVDEHQHQERPCECEQARMVNISQAMQCPRTIWIRYNPDTFKSAESRRWTKNKRLAELVTWLRHFMVMTPEELHTKVPDAVMVLHLFFDGYMESRTSLKTITTL